MNARNLVEAVRVQRIQWKSADKIRRIQERKLQAMIRHAYDRVPFYRETLEALKIKPEDIRTAADLAALPVLTKRRLNELPFEMKTASGTDPRSCRTSATSGTTGDPLTVFQSRADATRMNLSWIRGYLAAGMKPWHKTAAFIGRQRPARTRSWHEKLGLWRRYEISTWDPPSVWAGELRRIEPQVINGYVMTLKLLAEELRGRVPDSLRGFRPRFVFHSSAILDDSSRREFETVFGAAVYDFYGADEAGCIAWECRRCGAYHINSDLVIVEILKDGKPVRPGEEGEIVVTNLQSFVMPFIRYRLGDVGRYALRPIRCGREGLPLLDRIEGRTDDFILLETGERISPHPFYYCLDPVAGIRRWRVLQTDIRKLDVAVEPGPGFSDATIRTVKASLEQLLKGRIHFEIRTVEALPVSPGAKFRAVRSECGGSTA